MTATNGTAVLADDQTSVVVAKSVDVVIHPPDTITLGMWQEYNTARLASMDKYPDIDNWTAKYYGALAIIKAGYFHLEGLDKLKTLITKGDGDQRSIPLAVVGFVVRYIAMPIEQALDAPLSDYFLAQL